jgi:hypothetical protein
VRERALRRKTASSAHSRACLPTRVACSGDQVPGRPVPTRNGQQGCHHDRGPSSGPDPNRAPPVGSRETISSASSATEAGSRRCMKVPPSLGGRTGRQRCPQVGQLAPLKAAELCWVLGFRMNEVRAVRIRTVRSPGTSRPRGRRRPLSRRGHRWRTVGLVGSPLTPTRRPLLRTPVTPSTGVDVCSPGDYVGITGHLPSALRAAAVRAAVPCSGAQRDRCRPGLGWPPAGAASADGHSARPR